MEDETEDHRPAPIEVANEVCRPDTLFRDHSTGRIWRLAAWNRWSATLVEWRKEDRAIYPIDDFERAIRDGQFEKLRGTLTFENG